MAEEKKSSSRTYHVFKRDTDNFVWELADSTEASNPTQAIRLVATEGGTGRYAAVPDGNWTEQNVLVEIPPPRVTFVDEPTAAVEPEQEAELLAALDEIAADTLETDAASGTLTREEFEERKQELAARRSET